MDRKKWKNELSYLWMDYKWFLLAGLLAAALAIHFLVSALRQREPALSVMLIDSHPSTGQESMQDDYMEAAGLDPSVCRVEILTSLMFSDSDSGTYTMTSLSRFMADIGNNKLDVAGMLEDDFVKYDRPSTWADLTELPDWKEWSFSSSGCLQAADGRVIGIYADALPGLEQYGCYEDPDARGVLGILYNAPHRDEAGRYLKYLASRKG